MVKSHQINKAKYTRVHRSEKSADEQGYTVTEDEHGYTVTGRTEVKSEDEHGYTATG